MTSTDTTIEAAGAAAGAGRATGKLPFARQFTVRAVVIGVLGCVVITASSVYLALKLGALPWPIFFVVLLSLFVLRLVSKLPAARKTNINEVNVCASIMSAGAMVAGGLAFTIPGIFMLMPDVQFDYFPILLCALCGVALGSIGTSLMRKHFIERAELVYPIGKSAAEILEAGDTGGRKAGILFGSLAFAGVFTVLRDLFGLIPRMLLDFVRIEGVTFGVYFSPMAIAMGFLIGPVAAGVWLLGAVVGNFGIVVGAPTLGLLSVAQATDIRLSLGIGVMIGCGLGIVIKVVIPRAKDLLAPMVSAKRGDAIVPMRWAPFVAAAVVLVLSFALNLGLLAGFLITLLTWIVVFMAAQCTGQTGINPMEVFGLIVLLIVALVCSVGGVEGFLVAACATVACGFVGDLMNDFKAGAKLGTSPKAQWIGVTIGGLIGAVIGALIIGLLVNAYGTGAFGAEAAASGGFVAAQASAVASMIGGIPSLPAFIVGVVLGVVLYQFGAPVITLGLGIYLPFYLSLTMAVGLAVWLVLRKVKPQWTQSSTSAVIASGLLGGESIVGVIVALIAVVAGLAQL